MMLLTLIAILLICGPLAAAAGRWSREWPRWIALVATLIGFQTSLDLWMRHAGARAIFSSPSAPITWMEEFDRSWIPRFGIHFHLAVDGLSLLLVVLSFFLGTLAVLASWNEIQERVGFFHLHLLWTLAGVVGVFLAADLFLFYFAWEMMLIPMSFLIFLWGHERRVYAALKFFLFTQLSGLLMLVAILSLVLFHARQTGTWTFQYADLLGTVIPPGIEIWIMLGFFIAFAVKLPMVPFHTWLPDAHTEAPTAGSVLLAGLLLKTGAYGMLRFVIPLFPISARRVAPIVMTLAVVGILYGALLAYSQTDLKRLVAYTSVSHLGFVLLGIFAWNGLALQGALVEMLAHGISTGALFILVGQLQERMQTREIGRMGGLWETIPRLSGAGLFFAMGALGLPGLGHFIGEFLILFGTYPVSRWRAALATVGLLAATLYALRLVERTFHGPNLHRWRLPDLSAREIVVLVPLILALIWLGLYPQPVFDTFRIAMISLQQTVADATLALAR
ncbi:MAG: NADH-quinone oxidoreductase subunit M [Nitrospirae bacterium]|nr:NADH-quinone oxidoreductase subunit M [Candidatus Manganitrophaceae bacterium]